MTALEMVKQLENMKRFGHSENFYCPDWFIRAIAERMVSENNALRLSDCVKFVSDSLGAITV